MAAAAPLHADRGHGRANVANRDRGRDYSRRAHPSDTPGRITDGHLSPKPIPTILSDASGQVGLGEPLHLLLDAGLSAPQRLPTRLQILRQPMPTMRPLERK